MTDKIKKILSITLLCILTFVVSMPFLIMLIGAFKPSMSLIQFPMDLNPFENTTLSNVIKVIEDSDMLLWLKNSTVISLSVAVLTVFLSLTAGYAFAIIKMRGSEILFGVVIATMLMPKQLLLIPNYLVANNLNLQNTLYGVVLTSVAPSFGIFLCRQMIYSIPNDIFDAAEIDGCSEFKKFTRIVLPLSLPSVGTVAIFSFFETFNDYLWQLIMISDKALKTLPIGVAMFAQKIQGNRGVQMASALLSTIPLVIIFVLLQKFFIKDSTAGSIKG